MSRETEPIIENLSIHGKLRIILLYYETFDEELKARFCITEEEMLPTILTEHHYLDTIIKQGHCEQRTHEAQKSSAQHLQTHFSEPRGRIPHHD